LTSSTAPPPSASAAAAQRGPPRRPLLRVGLPAGLYSSAAAPSPLRPPPSMCSSTARQPPPAGVRCACRPRAVRAEAPKRCGPPHSGEALAGTLTRSRTGPTTAGSCSCSHASCASSTTASASIWKKGAKGLRLWTFGAAD
jgi:hypothetical protein